MQSKEAVLRQVMKEQFVSGVAPSPGQLRLDVDAELLKDILDPDTKQAWLDKIRNSDQATEKTIRQNHEISLALNKLFSNLNSIQESKANRLFQDQSEPIIGNNESPRAQEASPREGVPQVESSMAKAQPSSQKSKWTNVSKTKIRQLKRR